MKPASRDKHILRYFSSFITVSAGRVVHITEPKLTFCPLACHFIKEFKNARRSNGKPIKQIIKKAIESQIKEYGFYTGKRLLLMSDITVPYGASEILMCALKKKTIDAAVIVCDGAGTVITDNGDLVQGIGAKMNSLFQTSPIQKTMSRINKLGGHVVSESAAIDQAKGVERAIQMGYKNIAVTVNGYSSLDSLIRVRKHEKKHKVRITILVVCTTGINKKQALQIKKHADMVWACASQEIRSIVGRKAVLQLSKPIPVFVLTGKGLELTAAYEHGGALLNSLELNKQYLISNESGGKPIKLGLLNAFLCEKKLPVLSHNCPTVR
jgi:putative methanogenesis marker protein 8